uniref:G-protein coupled receptors family 1 profile domain-containing protein n=1 Tax=Echeneis naucrates TaxID=173247 RepID=A0A665WXS2_ECHNA
GVMCVGVNFFGYLLVSVSVGNMVLISIDRYVAICEPMFYSTRVTVRRVQLCVCLCWTFSAVHSSWILRHSFKQPETENSCSGECVSLPTYTEGIVDLAVTFLGPILIIIILYLRVFVVAVSQARAMRSHVTAVTHQQTQTVKPKKSEMKAARTLGVVVAVFLLCSAPYYISNFETLSNLDTLSTLLFGLLLLYLNSCVNPMIYAFFYPWFRKAIRHIVTLQILQPGSSQTRFM